MKTIEQMVQQEVMCCMSSLVSTLAGGGSQPLGGDGRGNGRLRDLESLCEQASELAMPVSDYEEAAIQAGWKQIIPTGDNSWYRNDRFIGQPDQTIYAASAEQACELDKLDPIDSEVYEHWAVSQWLAERLIEQGEKVDTDFGSLNVWARTNTGQQISADAVIERIYAAMMAPVEG